MMSRGSAARFLFFFFNDTATTEIYTLSLHDALPILALRISVFRPDRERTDVVALVPLAVGGVRVRHLTGGPVGSFDQDGRVFGRHGVGGVHHRVDGGLGHLASKVPLPVILQPERDLREEALDLEVADRTD